MAKHVLPFRMSLLRRLAVPGQTLTGQEVLAALAEDYGSERQCNLDGVLDNLFNMLSLGLVSLEEERFDEDHNLILSFAITDEGRACTKYYPADWKF